MRPDFERRLKHTLAVDVRAELEVFPWVRPRWTADKLIAASPFRYDTHPSFFVRLEPYGPYPAGTWADSGAVDPEWRSGNFVKLLAFLRGETYEETTEYLTVKYGYAPYAPPTDEEIPQLRLRPLCPRGSPVKRIDERILDAYRYRHPYLTRRGISESVQRLMGVGYDRNSRAITIPWRNPDGTLGNVKYRRVNEKTFWYARGGRPIREMVYALDVVYKRKIKRAVIVEAEIDAMTLMSVGIPAIAVGGTAFNEYKRDLIVRSPLEEIVIMADHDEPGQALKRRLITALTPYMRVRVAGYPARFKDANELAVKIGGEAIRTYVERSHTIKLFTKNYYQKCAKRVFILNNKV